MCYHLVGGFPEMFACTDVIFGDLPCCGFTFVVAFVLLLCVKQWFWWQKSTLSEPTCTLGQLLTWKKKRDNIPSILSSASYWLRSELFYFQIGNSCHCAHSPRAPSTGHLPASCRNTLLWVGSLQVGQMLWPCLVSEPRCGCWHSQILGMEDKKLNIIKRGCKPQLAWET